MNYFLYYVLYRLQFIGIPVLIMNEENKGNDFEMDEDISDDIHIKSISVPGGWVYLSIVRRRDGDEYYTSAISSCYVPGRR